MKYRRSMQVMKLKERQLFWRIIMSIVPFKLLFVIDEFINNAMKCFDSLSCFTIMLTKSSITYFILPKDFLYASPCDSPLIRQTLDIFGRQYFKFV